MGGRDSPGGRARRTALAVVLATLIIEAVTCGLRFGLGLQSGRDTSALARWTLGLRIHHGYVGVVLLMIGGCMKPFAVSGRSGSLPGSGSPRRISSIISSCFGC